MNNSKLLKQLDNYLTSSIYLNKTALKQPIPNVSFSPGEESDFRYLMYLLTHEFYQNKYSSLVTSLMAATDIATLKRILNNSMTYYVFDDKISEIVQKLAAELTVKPTYPKIDINVQKALNKLFNANIVEDGFLGEKTQEALNNVKVKYNVKSNQEMMQKLLNMYNNPEDAGY